jgi:hypothetical protein
VTDDVTVTTEHEYTSLDTVEWLDSVADNVSDYWRGIVERITPWDECEHLGHYRLSGYGERCARDRVLAALSMRGDRHYGHAESWMGHTSNFDSNFYDNFGWHAVDHYRADGWHLGVLLFVSMGDYIDSGLTYVYRLDSWDDVYQTMSPRIGYSCETCHEWGSTTDGGYSFETDNGQTRKEVIADGLATCSNGHRVTLSAETF